jgi:hypothetical protein
MRSGTLSICNSPYLRKKRFISKTLDKKRVNHIGMYSLMCSSLQMISKLCLYHFCFKGNIAGGGGILVKFIMKTLGHYPIIILESHPTLSPKFD